MKKWLLGGIALLALACQAQATTPRSLIRGRALTTVIPSPTPVPVSIVPGQTPPGVNASSSAGVTISANYNDVTPLNHGDPLDNGYGIKGSWRWDELPFVEVRGQRHIGGFAYHPPTDLEKSQGIDSNICSVDMRADEGQWFTINAPTPNPDAGGAVDWNAIIDWDNFDDGLHKLDAVAHPCTGPDIIANGPASDQYGNGYETVKLPAVKIDDGGGRGVAGNILTVHLYDNLGDRTVANWNDTNIGSAQVISIGQSVSAFGAGPNTFIDGDKTHSAELCIPQTGAPCSGQGRDGTYHVTQAAVAVGAAFTGFLGPDATQQNILTVTDVSTTAGGIVPGQIISGPGVAAGTRIDTAAGVTGSLSGVSMNATAVNGTIHLGEVITGTGVAANTTVTGNALVNSSACVADLGSPCTGAGGIGTYATSVSQTLGLRSLIANGTGSGGAGTYPVTVAQTAPAETMVASTHATLATQRSLYFLTNRSNGLSRPVVYVCAATCTNSSGSVTGSDMTGTGVAWAPYATIGKAETAISTADPSAFHKGMYGGIACLMGGLTYAWTDPGTHTRPDASAGYLVLQSADQTPCSIAGDPGGATVSNDNSIANRNYFATRTLFRRLKFNGVASNVSGGAAWYLSADHVAEVHDAINKAGILGNGAYYCLESTSWFGADGMCSGAVMVRNGNIKYNVNADGFHDVPVLVNNTVDGQGNVMEWARGDTTAGSSVITNVDILPADLSGYTLAQIFGATFLDVNAANLVQGAGGSSCFGAAYAITGTNDALHQITLASPATKTCRGGFLWFYGAHADNLQLQIGNPHSDVYIVGNKFNTNYPSFTQGLFLETEFMSGVYVKNNVFTTDPIGVERMLAVDGANENVILSGNTFNGTSSYSLDLQETGRNETLMLDRCIPTVTFTGTGPNLRRQAAVTRACYTTTTP